MRQGDKFRVAAANRASERRVSPADMGPGAPKRRDPDAAQPEERRSWFPWLVSGLFSLLAAGIVGAIATAKLDEIHGWACGGSPSLQSLARYMYRDCAAARHDEPSKIVVVSPSDPLTKSALGVPVPAGELYAHQRGQFLRAARDGDDAFLVGLRSRGFRIRATDLCELSSNLIGPWTRPVSPVAIEILVESIDGSQGCRTFDVLRRKSSAELPLDRYVLEVALTRLPRGCGLSKSTWQIGEPMIDAIVKAKGASEDLKFAANAYLTVLKAITGKSRQDIVALCAVVLGGGRSATPKDELAYEMAGTCVENDSNFFVAMDMERVTSTIMGSVETEKEHRLEAVPRYCNTHIRQDYRMSDLSYIRAALARWVK